MNEEELKAQLAHAELFGHSSRRLLAFFEELRKEAPEVLTDQDVALIILSAATKALIASHGPAHAARMMRELATNLERAVPTAN
jgi:hypothetical protein